MAVDSVLPFFGASCQGAPGSLNADIKGVATKSLNIPLVLQRPVRLVAHVTIISIITVGAIKLSPLVVVAGLVYLTFLAIHKNEFSKLISEFTLTFMRNCREYYNEIPLQNMSDAKLFLGGIPFDDMKIPEGAHIVSLVEDWEYEQVGIFGKAKSKPLANLTHLPMRDKTIPTVDIIKKGVDAIEIAIARGEDVYIHCKHGLGRSGAVVVAYLAKKSLSTEGKPTQERLGVIVTKAISEINQSRSLWLAGGARKVIADFLSETLLTKSDQCIGYPCKTI